MASERLRSLTGSASSLAGKASSRDWGLSHGLVSRLEERLHGVVSRWGSVDRDNAVPLWSR